MGLSCELYWQLSFKHIEATLAGVNCACFHTGVDEGQRGTQIDRPEHGKTLNSLW